MLALTSAAAAPTPPHGALLVCCDRRRRRAGWRAPQPHVLGLLIFLAPHCRRKKRAFWPSNLHRFLRFRPASGHLLRSKGGDGWSDTCASGNPSIGVPNPVHARRVHPRRVRHTVLLWRSCVPGRAGNARGAQKTRATYGWRLCCQILRSRDGCGGSVLGLRTQKKVGCVFANLKLRTKLFSRR